MGNRYGGDGSGGEYDGRQPDAAEQYVLETFERGEPTGSAAGGAARGRSRGPSPSPSAASRATDDGRVVADGAGVDSYDDLYESVERTVEAAEEFGLSDGDVEAVKEEVRRLERRGMDPEAASERVDELVQYEETDPIGSLGRPDLGPNAPDELRFGDAKRAVNLGAESTGSSHRTDRIWRVESNDGTVYVQDCSDGDAEYAAANAVVEGVFERAGVDAPRQYFDAETGMLVSEGIGGVSGKDLYDARSAPGAYGDKVPGDPDAIEVDREAYLEAAATSVLTGDGDWSIDNVVLRDEDVTEPVPIDSDFAGEHTIKEIEYRAVSAITRVADRLEVDVDESDAMEALERAAERSDPDVIRERIPGAVLSEATGSGAMQLEFERAVRDRANTMALNVEMVRNGELPWQDGRESFVGSGIGEDRVREVADEHGRRRFDLARSAVEFRKEGHDPGTALKLALDER